MACFEGDKSFGHAIFVCFQMRLNLSYIFFLLIALGFHQILYGYFFIQKGS